MQGKIAIVTGGSRGIGRGICLALCERGAMVVACARNERALQELADEAKKRETAGSIVPRKLDGSEKWGINGCGESVGDE